MNLTQAIKKLIKHKNFQKSENGVWGIKRNNWGSGVMASLDSKGSLTAYHVAACQISLSYDDLCANDWKICDIIGQIFKPKKSLKIIECQNCSNEGESDHTCPYREDINDDCETLCNCCSDCTYNCAMEI